MRNLNLVHDLHLRQSRLYSMTTLTNKASGIANKRCRPPHSRAWKQATVLQVFLRINNEAKITVKDSNYLSEAR